MLKLRPLLFSAFVIVGASVMIALGIWQLNRLKERRAHNAQIAARMSRPPIAITGGPLGDVSSLEYRPGVVTGVYDFSQEVVIRNRSFNEAAGVHLLTPLRIAGSDQAILIDRGWIPYTAADRQMRTAYATLTDAVTVTGLIRPSQPRPSPIAPRDPTPVPGSRLDAWFWVDISQIQQQVPYPLMPIFIEQAPGPDPRALPAAGYDVELTDGPHLSYAIQWFSFTAILVVGSIALARQRRTGKSRQP